MSKYKDMTMTQFIINTLEVDLTPDQQIIVEMYEELRNEKVLENNMPVNTTVSYKPLG